MKKQVVILLGGYKESGKDTVADYLAGKYENFVKIGMSDILREAIIIVNPWIQLSSDIPGVGKTGDFVKYIDIERAVGYTGAKEQEEVRDWLQLEGTDVCRNLLDEDIWVKAIYRRIEGLLDQGKSVLVTGTRFPNEIELENTLRDEDIAIGVSVWVDGDERAKVKPVVASRTADHSSEHSLTSLDFEYILDNNGTLKELYAHTDALLHEIWMDYAA